MKPKRLLITFDYELFLGEQSGLASECCINPTNKILRVLDDYNLKGIFFVDITYLLFLQDNIHKSEVLNNDYQLIKEQLINLYQRNHYIFPHFHPHWKDAVLINNNTEFSLTELKHYRFHSLGTDEQSILWEKAVQLLNDLLDTESKPYWLFGYRAGGFGIKPFDDFYKYFKKYDVKADFSVLPSIDRSYVFDNIIYGENIPNRPFRFSKSVDIEDLSGEFLEFPISNIGFHAIDLILSKISNKFDYRLNKNQMAKGFSAVKNPPKRSRPKLKISFKEPASIELLNRVKLYRYKKFIDENDYMHFISHPKMIAEFNLASFTKFINYASRKYVLQTDLFEYEQARVNTAK